MPQNSVLCLVRDAHVTCALLSASKRTRGNDRSRDCPLFNDGRIFLFFLSLELVLTYFAASIEKPMSLGKTLQEYSHFMYYRLSKARNHSLN